MNIKQLIENGDMAPFEQRNIKITNYDSGLTVLNYNMIDSPKTDPIVAECRGLIFNRNTGHIVCRPFARFFNFGEAGTEDMDVDWSKLDYAEKLDGSLLKLYYDGDTWQLATRGTAYGEGNDYFFRNLALKALGLTMEELAYKCNRYLCNFTTYLFELTSPENRIVTPYVEDAVYFLGARDVDGFIATSDWMELILSTFNVKQPKMFNFDTPHYCKQKSALLPGLQEGFVAYEYGVPIFKIKSPLYVAAHLIRGEGLNEKRICGLVTAGEVSEYLGYFPNDKVLIDPIENSFRKLLRVSDKLFDNIRHIEDQKHYASLAKQCNPQVASLLFSMRKNQCNAVEAFEKVKDKVSFLQNYLKS